MITDSLTQKISYIIISLFFNDYYNSKDIQDYELEVETKLVKNNEITDEKKKNRWVRSLKWK